MLQFIRKRMLNAYFALPMLVCMALITFSSNGVTPMKKYHFTGEEIFDGVFFYHGKYLESNPELKKTQNYFIYEHFDESKRVQVARICEQIKKTLLEGDRDVFKIFEDDLKNPNKYLVYKAVNDMRSKMIQVFSEKYSIKNTDKIDTSGQQLVLDGGLYVAVVCIIIGDGSCSFAAESVALSEQSKLLEEQIAKNI